MARYFLHVRDGKFIRDEEGQEFPSLEAARSEAVASARSIMREEIWRGKLPLRECIEIANADGEVLLTVPFRDTIEIDG